MMNTKVTLAPSEDYLERVEAAASAADEAASDGTPLVVLATFAISFVLVAAAAALVSAPLFVVVAAATMIAAAEIFGRANVPALS